MASTKQKPDSLTFLAGCSTRLTGWPTIKAPSFPNSFSRTCQAELVE